MRIYVILLAFILIFSSLSLQAQENENQKISSLNNTTKIIIVPALPFNTGVIKLKESLGYRPNSHTHIGIGKGFKFGLRINF